MSSPVLRNQAPFEVLYKAKPTYLHLRSFRCLCYATTLKRNRDKLQPRANSCIFIGYPFNQKTYKLFDLKAKKVIVSRDVIFHETIFPFHSLPHSSDIPLPAISKYIPNTLNLSLSIHDPFSTEAVIHPQNNFNSSPSSCNTSDFTSSPVLNQSVPNLSPHNPSQINSHSSQPLRRSTRTHKQPAHLQDFFVV